MTTRFVIDTSIFVNPETQKEFGEDPTSALTEFLDMARERGIEIYIPLSIYRELGHFVDTEILVLFERQAVIRGPDLYNIQVPAAILHTFIGDLRSRVDRGLRVAESAIRRLSGAGDQVHWLRQHYRAALRTGIIDSVEDLDVVLLAKEIGGSILSADEGIARMAQSLGIEVLSAASFVRRYS